MNNSAPTSTDNSNNPPAEPAKHTAKTAVNRPDNGGGGSTTSPSTTIFNDNTGQPFVAPTPKTGIAEDHGYILGND